MDGPPRGFGDLGRMAIYFQGAGEHWQFFQGFGEQAHSFGDLGSPAKSKKNLAFKEKPSFLLIFSKKSSASGGKTPPPPQIPPWISKCINFRVNMLIWIDIDDWCSK